VTGAPADFWDAVRGIAGELSKLDLEAHKATKLRARKAALAAVHDAIAADYAALARRDQSAATAGHDPHERCDDQAVHVARRPPRGAADADPAVTGRRAGRRRDGGQDSPDQDARSAIVTSSR
jgi:hypothetical protein